MTYGLDTSVVLRILTATNDAFAVRVRDRIEEMLDQGEDFFISDLAINEGYFALQHHYGATKEVAIKAFQALASTDGFSFSAEAQAALNTPEAWKANPGFIDRILAAGYASKGMVTLSCEKSFRRLDLAQVIA